MDTAKKQKIQNALLSAIEYAAAGFILLMALVFSLMFIVCLTQVFTQPVISLLGCAGFGGGAWFLWGVLRPNTTR